MADIGTVTIIRDDAQGRQFSAPDGHRMYLYSESGKLAFAVDIAPREIEYGGMPMDWASADRSGNTPLLLHKSMPLRTMSFSFTLTDKIDMQAPQTSKVTQLQQMGRSFERFLVRFSPTEQGLWRITDLKVTSQLRTAATDEIARATVTIQLTEASDPAPAVGPVSRPAPPAAPPSAGGRTYRVVKGDTLWAIAKRYYGAGTSWPRIFDANRNLIKDPHWIYPAQVFTIP